MLLTSHPLLFIDFINRFNLNQTNPTQQDEGRCPRFRSRYPRGFGHAHLPRPKACGNGCRCTHHHPGPPIRFDFGEPRERLLVRTSSCSSSCIDDHGSKEALNNYTAADFEAAGFPAWVRGRYTQIATHESEHVALLSSTLGNDTVAPCTYALSVVQGCSS